MVPAAASTSGDSSPPPRHISRGWERLRRARPFPAHRAAGLPARHRSAPRSSRPFRRRRRGPPKELDEPAEHLVAHDPARVSDSVLPSELCPGQTAQHPFGQDPRGALGTTPRLLSRLARANEVNEISARRSLALERLVILPWRLAISGRTANSAMRVSIFGSRQSSPLRRRLRSGVTISLLAPRASAFCPVSKAPPTGSSRGPASRIALLVETRPSEPMLSSSTA